MTDVDLIPASVHAHRAALLSLNRAYLSWLAAELDRWVGPRHASANGVPAPDPAASVLESLCSRSPPAGIFYLVRRQGRFIAMGGLRGLSAGRAEIKRLYVHPDARGAGIGTHLLERLLADAAAFGYGQVCLDSAPFMAPAHRLYEAAGFVDCGPYTESEVPEALHGRWRFMTCPLTPRRGSPAAT